MKTLLLIDGNNNFYRAYFSKGSLTYNDKNIQAVFQFPRILAGLIKRYKPHKTIICWDGKSSEHRRKLLPNYRVRDRNNIRFDLEDFLYQKRYAMKMAYLLGITQLYNYKIEADDYIYAICNEYKEKGYRIIIVSTDKDFNQLIGPKCHVHSEKLGKLIHHKNAEKLLGYKPSQTVDYLSLLGDDSDKIPGYRGMGEVRTKQFLAKFGSIKNFLMSDETFGKLDKKELKRIYRLNRKLISLKWFYKNYMDGVDYSFYKNIPDPKLKRKAYKKLCIKFGLRQNRQDEFINQFIVRK